MAAAASPTAAAGTAATQVAAVPAAAAPASGERTAVTRVAPSAARAASRLAAGAASGWRSRLVVLAVAVLGGWLGYRAWAGRALAVPAVVGLSRGQAVDALRHEGFVVRTAGGYSDAYARGFVMAQRPGSGATLHKGGTVRLVVSRGLLHPAVVSVLGMTSGQAATALRGQGFVPHRLWRHSSSVPVGQIVHQSPAPTTRLLRGSAVRYWVSLGPLKVRVPNVVGASEGSATDTLHAAGFTVAVKDTLGLGTFPGNVTKQAPAAGSRAARGGADHDLGGDLLATPTNQWASRGMAAIACSATRWPPTALCRLQNPRHTPAVTSYAEGRRLLAMLRRLQNRCWAIGRGSWTRGHRDVSCGDACTAGRLLS